jgi:hypothetical protein
MAIPWTHFGIVPTAGDIIGFDIGVNDDDNDNMDLNRDNQLRWTVDNDDWWNPSSYGEITLLGTYSR